MLLKSIGITDFLNAFELTHKILLLECHYFVTVLSNINFIKTKHFLLIKIIDYSTIVGKHIYYV